VVGTPVSRRHDERGGTFAERADPLIALTLLMGAAKQHKSIVDLPRIEMVGSS
jgi:hypothetical protein